MARRIGLIARGHDGLAATAREVVAEGGAALPLALDVAEPDAVERAAQAIEDRLGAIDLWINNAMVSVLAPVSDMHAAEYRRVMEVCYLGTVHGTLAALRRMRPRGHGTILQASSALAYRGIPLQSAYCALRSTPSRKLPGLAALRAPLTSDRACASPWIPAAGHQHAPVRLDAQPRAMPAAAGPAHLPAGGRCARHPLVGRASRAQNGDTVWSWSTVKAVIGNALLPGYADRVLARMGFGAQQTRVPSRPDRLDNLWYPLPGDHGAHGAFDVRGARAACSGSW